MTRLAAWLSDLRGWRRWALAIMLGAASCLALPPFHVVPVLAVTLTGLVLLIGAAGRARTAFAVGWWFGFGFFLAGLYWMANAFAVAGTAEWAAPIAVVGAAAASAVFVGLTALVTHFGADRPTARVVVFGLAWTASEGLRSFAVLGGFPWNLLGYSWMGSLAVSQSAALFGVFGLSFITVLTMATPAIALTGTAPRRWLPLGLSLALLAALWIGGSLRLGEAARVDFADVRLALVQANIAQHHKWRDDLRALHFQRHLDMTADLGETPAADPAPTPVTLVIWPETAAPYLLESEAERRLAMADAMPNGGVLITGAIRATPRGHEPFEIWNSLHALDDTGTIIATYDKARLVPFGEYMPLRDYLPFDKLVEGGVDYSRGPGRITWRLPGLPPVSPLICYEAVFPGRVIDDSDRPAWLLNVTNDGWYGVSTGPYQHLAQARMRAIEEGMAMVRAANTGISAVVDPHGRLVASLGLSETGVVTAPLPRPLPSATIYARFGDWPLLVGGLILLVILWRRRIQ